LSKNFASFVKSIPADDEEIPNVEAPIDTEEAAPDGDVPAEEEVAAEDGADEAPPGGEEEVFLKIMFLWQMPLFHLSTHNQCILSHFIHNSTAMFP
jgi:hypothetical protein